MEVPSEKIWHPVLRAVDTDPRDVAGIRGASGLEHPVAAVGVDDEKRRIVVITAEPDARSAAMAQADIQSALQSVKVVVARPVAVNLADLAQDVRTSLGEDQLSLDQFQS